MQKPNSGAYYLGAIAYPYRKTHPWKLVSNSGRDWQWFYFAPLNLWTSLFCSRFFSMKVLALWLLSTARVHHTQKAQFYTEWRSKVTVFIQHQLPQTAPFAMMSKLLPTQVDLTPCFSLVIFTPPCSLIFFPCEEASCDQFPVWLQTELVGWCLRNLVRGTVGIAFCRHGCPAALRHFAP